ncbi:MAG: hypothetical protein Q9160_007009 [Pyrenula sp. 1 TL-2023]
MPTIIEPLESVWAPSFSDLYSQLLTTLPPPLLPPQQNPNPKPSPSAPTLNARIASLQCHPTLEALLHILNSDLPSAHFLVRHMESPPAYEGMLIHAILHRVEGDYDNARAWYRDVAKSEPDVFRSVWGNNNINNNNNNNSGDGGEAQGGLDAALSLVSSIEALRKSEQGDKEDLEQQSLDEIKATVMFCAKRFGTGRWEDASEAWVVSEEAKRGKKGDMVVGGEGWRQF